MDEIIFYTDGGCEPNPGMGAWAIVCVNPHLEFSGVEEKTTNNRMEMTAVLEAIKKGREMNKTIIRIFSDSQYVVKGFNIWMHSWHKRGWKKGMGPIANPDLWNELYQLRKNVILQWVKGHADNEYNTLADEIVRSTYNKHFSEKMTY